LSVTALARRPTVALEVTKHHAPPCSQITQTEPYRDVGLGSDIHKTRIATGVTLEKLYAVATSSVRVRSPRRPRGDGELADRCGCRRALRAKPRGS
jgi:hypothetical protein